MHGIFSWCKKHPGIVVLIILILAWSVFLLFIDPQQLVEFIGVENTYLVTFLLAVFGGVSTFTSASFYTSVAAFAAGGSSPLILALVGGTGLFISNSVFYYIAVRGRDVFSGSWKKGIDILTKWIERLPAPLVYTGVFAYTGLTPLPDDILMIALGISSYPFIRFAPFLLAGNITVIFILATLATGGFALFG